MDCESILTLDCTTLCKYEARNNFRLRLNKSVPASPDTIEVIYDGTDSDFPCASTFDFGDCKCGATAYGLFSTATKTSTTCDSGNIWVLGGLLYYFNDCTFETKSEFNISHSRSEIINIGNPNLNFWSCRECKCRTELTEEVRCVVNTTAELPASPICGRRCMVRNGGNPIEYVAVDIGAGICSWRQVNNTFATAATQGGLGAVGVVCPPANPALPLAYNVGCASMDALALGNRCGNNYTHPFALIPTGGARTITSIEQDLAPSNPATSGSTIISTLPITLLNTYNLVVDTTITGSYTLQDLPEEASDITFTVEVLDSLLVVQSSTTIQSNGDLVSNPALTRFRNDTGSQITANLVAGNYFLRVTANVTETSVNTWHALTMQKISHKLLWNPSC